MKLKKDRFACGDKLSAPFGGGTMMRRLTVVSVAVALSAAVPAGTLTWTGGSATSDNFSDSANWSPAQAPASGDTLVFRGETRTSPVNDLDPELFTFKELILSNDNSSGCSASFTFSGNRLKLTSSITLVKAVSGSLTDVFGLDVEFSGSGNKKIGGGSLNNHHITFNGGVSGPSNVDLETPSQYAGTIYFNGPISGFSGFYRPNGGANIYFRGLNTAFTGSEGYKINQGNMYFIDADNFGPAVKFRSGQGAYSTAGCYYFDPTNDVTITATIAVNAPSQVNNGLTLANRTAGTTLTFTGNVVEGGTANNVGTRLAVDGSGTGVLKGNFTKDRMAFLKQGSGTWILSDEIETCSMTGLVTVSAGKLVVDCTLQPNQCMTVSANATIAGKGTLGAPVTFKSGARYEVSVDGNGTYNTLTIPGTVTLEGNVTVSRTGGETLAPGSRTALLAFGAKGGPGSFVIGSGFPGDAVLQVDGNVLYVDVPSATLTWNGAASGTWNTTDANWSGSVSTFSDGMAVTFPDLADAAKRAVSISAAVKPLSVTVAAAADRPYVFSGEGSIENATAIEFTGTATNTLSVPVRNVSAVNVSAGRLVLDGDVENGVITVGEGASLTQTVNSAISGTSAVSAHRTTVDLLGENTFTGGLVAGGDVTSESIRTDVNVRSPNGVGNGDVSVKYNSYLNIHDDCAVTNHTLHFWGYNNTSRLYVIGKHVFTWAGDIVVHEYPSGEMMMAEAGVLRLGKEDGTSTFSSTHGRSVTVVGDIHMYANFNSGSTFAFRNNLWLYSTNNVWGSFGINTGTATMMAKNVLPGNKPISMLQQWNNVQYQANLDLNGFDQTVTALNVTDYNHSIPNWARIRSALPATLTISNATDSAFSDTNTFYVLQCVTLRKMGAGTWTVGCQNTSTGDFEVVEGTVSLAAAESLPVGENSTLRIADGAFLDLPAGVAAEISYAEQIGAGGTRIVRANLYGGAECANPAATRVAWITGAGTLRVKRDTCGTTIIFR